MLSRRMALGGLLAVAIVVFIALASGGREAGQPLRVAAAADLYPAFTEIGRLFEAETGRKVEFIFGSTGLLAKQIEQGAPVDVFAAADAKFIDKLGEQKLLLPGSKRLYAFGRLALVMIGNDPAPVVQVAGGYPLDGTGAKRPQDNMGERGLSALLDSRVRKVAIANPGHAPYGLAASQALHKSGLWEQVEPKLVYARDVRNALQFVQTGNADAALVALPLLGGMKESPRFWVLESSLYTSPRQTMAIIGSTKQAGVSRAFVDFVSGPQGRRILEKHGFGLP